MSDFTKKVVRSLLDHIMLEAINEVPRHGYELINVVRKRYGVYLGPSTVYPVLNDLEADGLILSKWDFTSGKPRKKYTITYDGKKILDQDRRDFDTLVTTVSNERRGV